MTELALRPRSATEIIDLAVRLLRRHFGALFTIALVGLVPNLIVQIVLVSTILADPVAAADRFGSVAALTAPIGLVFGSLMIGSLLACGDAALRDGTADVGLAIRRGAARIGTVIGVSLLAGLATGVGFVLLVVPGVYVALRLATALPAAVVEGDGVFDALRRAWARSDGHVLHTLKTVLLLMLLYVVFFLVLGVAGAVVGAVVGGTVGAAGGVGAARTTLVVSQVLTTLLAAAVYPLLTNTLLLLAYDLRVRREGYDVEAMANALGAAR